MTYRLYHMQDSGNCYKVRLLLAQLGQPHELIDVDILKGESRTSDYLERNPNGRTPMLAIDDEYLPESNAILWYLAEKHGHLPNDLMQRARILQWMFFEQYSHEPFIATSRFWIKILGKPEEYAAEIAARRAGGEAALGVMETHLEANDFFAPGGYSIADIALYAYTHVADEGGFSLAPYPHVRAWLDRVREQPGHVDIVTRTA